ncbi:MAG: hypothetical protein ACRDY4_06730 [Acidimicrobiia bacterium]
MHTQRSRRLLAVVAGSVAVVAVACAPIKQASPQPGSAPSPPAPAELASDPIGADLVATATEPAPTQAFLVTNTGGETTDALITFFTASGCCVSPDFGVVTNTCDTAVLASGDSCAVTVEYTGVSGSVPSGIILVVKEPLPADVAEVRITITGQFVS